MIIPLLRFLQIPERFLDLGVAGAYSLYQVLFIRFSRRHKSFNIVKIVVETFFTCISYRIAREVVTEVHTLVKFIPYEAIVVCVAFAVSSFIQRLVRYGVMDSLAWFGKWIFQSFFCQYGGLEKDPDPRSEPREVDLCSEPPQLPGVGSADEEPTRSDCAGGLTRERRQNEIEQALADFDKVMSDWLSSVDGRMIDSSSEQLSCWQEKVKTSAELLLGAGAPSDLHELLASIKALSTALGSFGALLSIPEENSLRDEVFINLARVLSDRRDLSGRLPGRLQTREKLRERLEEIERKIEEVTVEYGAVVTAGFVRFELLRAGARAQIDRMTELHEAELEAIVKELIVNE
jgi:archaellum component FlaC